MSDPCCKDGTEWCVIAHDTSDEACRPLDDSLFDRPSGRRHIDPSLLLEVAKRCESDRVAGNAKLKIAVKELRDIHFSNVEWASDKAATALAAIAAIGEETL